MAMTVRDGLAYNDCTMENNEHWLRFAHQARDLTGVTIAEETLCRFQQLYALVIAGNKLTNLTRITELDAFCVQHLLDSLTLIPLLQKIPSPVSFMDIGSGAGFPALPLALMLPESHFVAVETVGKKARFIEEAAILLGLHNVTVLSERCEALGQNPQYREQFDVVSARAVAGMNILAEYCLPFLKVGGLFLAMKTADAGQKELAEAAGAIQLLGGEPVEIEAVHHPGLPNRVIIPIRKVGQIPAQYPRKPGMPSKKPLTG